jgi:hypothetical protein
VAEGKEHPGRREEQHDPEQQSDGK